MIELYSVSDSRKYTYNNEAKRRGENHQAEFSVPAGNTNTESVDGQTISADIENLSRETITGAFIDTVTYTFFGKKALMTKYSGINLDFEV